MSTDCRRSLSDKIIVVDDDPVFQRQLRETAKGRDSQIEITQIAASELLTMSEEHPDATFILDPGYIGEAEALIGKIRNAGHQGRILIAAANISVRNAVLLVRAGADDIMIKPVGKDTIAKTLSEIQDRASGSADGNDIAKQPAADFDEFIGTSPAMKHLYEMIEAVAPSSAPVFITGESGTGKELAARSVHANSPRCNKPFIALNCSAIPRDLMESEIFGHIKGAFTGAESDRAGAAELADGGTLFLDELCEMDFALQAKLLRFIQSGIIQRVGDSQPRTLDIRFICATNRNPVEEISAKRFREDLYYRLNVLPLKLVPLRDRCDDILRIAEACLTRFTLEEDAAFLKFTDDAVALLSAHPWPGNVRQLQNTVRRAVVLNHGDEITSGMLQATLADSSLSISSDIAASMACDLSEMAPDISASGIQPLAIQERGIIENAIRLCGGNIVETARALAVSPSTIYRKMNSWPEQFGI